MNTFKYGAILLLMLGLGWGPLGIGTALAQEPATASEDGDEDANQEGIGRLRNMVTDGVDVIQDQISAATSSEEEAGGSQDPVGDRITALREIKAGIRTLNEQLAELRSQQQLATTEQERTLIGDEIQSLAVRIEEMKAQFDQLATGVDRESIVERAAEDALAWESRLQEVLAPVIEEAWDATSRPREIERLRGEIKFYEDRMPRVTEAATRIRELYEATQEPELAAELRDLAVFWQDQEQVLTSQLEALRIQLAELEQKRATLSSAGEAVRTFFKDRRTRSLIISIIAFFLVLLILMFLWRVIHFVSPFHRKRIFPLLLRIMDLLYFLCAILLSFAALFAVLYHSADWMLIALAVLLVVGILLLGRQLVPAFSEQVAMLLNLGGVREGQRITLNGVPFKVHSLGFFCVLENPLLKPTRIKLPAKDLVGLRSRKWSKEEPWFPTRVDDWMILANGVYGMIVTQTPDTVVVDTRRGSYESYSTADFIANHPRNLSINSFSITGTLGLDYRHRFDVNGDIVNKVSEVLEAGFKKEWYGKHLERVIVELKHLGEYSLDVFTIGRFSGEAASEYTELGWKIQQLALDAANKYGWTITYPHFIMHQGAQDPATEPARPRPASQPAEQTPENRPPSQATARQRINPPPSPPSPTS